MNTAILVAAALAFALVAAPVLVAKEATAAPWECPAVQPWWGVCMVTVNAYDRANGVVCDTKFACLP